MENANIDWNAMSDAAISSEIGKFIKHRRLELNKTQDQLSKEAGLNRSTITQIENGEPVTLTSLIQLLRAIDALYVFDQFVVKEVISPLAYAKLKKEKKQRARSSKKKNENQSEW